MSLEALDVDCKCLDFDWQQDGDFVTLNLTFRQSDLTIRITNRDGEEIGHMITGERLIEPLLMYTVELTLGWNTRRKKLNIEFNAPRHIVII